MAGFVDVLLRGLILVFASLVLGGLDLGLDLVVLLLEVVAIAGVGHRYAARNQGHDQERGRQGRATHSAGEVAQCLTYLVGEGSA